MSVINFGKLCYKSKQPPLRPDSWSGVLDGTKDSMACLFVGSYTGDPVPTYGYSEDCLYINVYSPFPANSSVSITGNGLNCF